MGVYLNPGNEGFRMAVDSEIYVDKSGLISYTNSILKTEQRFVCISRPRRFGKSMAANMLAAYYGKDCNSEALFHGLAIAEDETFLKYLNQYNVVFLNIQNFLSRSQCVEDLINRIKRLVIRDLKKKYPAVDYFDDTDLAQSMEDIYADSGDAFIVIIDEWDCIFREFAEDKASQEKYLDFLRDLMKDRTYIHLAYMTGILPIKKYGTHSALNMFSEFSMVNPRQLAEYVGFTEEEVKALCEKYQMKPEEMKEWYDGYKFEKMSSVYSPKSVVEAVTSGICDTYWNQTETFEALRMYIDMNFEGLRDDVLSMLAGEKVQVNTGSFTNDMTTFHSEDDVFTLLIHLGYLGYDFSNKCVFIPNKEICEEFVNAVSVSQWGDVSKALKHSADTLNAIWQKNAQLTAQGIEQAHYETSHLQYNDENALSYTISLALYAARNFYHVYREMPTGKGFADMIYIPKTKFSDKPCLVVELKWNKKAEGAVAQIKQRNYCRSLGDYQGRILLIGINYDKKTKEHSCVIEEWEK